LVTEASEADVAGAAVRWRGGALALAACLLCACAREQDLPPGPRMGDEQARKGIAPVPVDRPAAPLERGALGAPYPLDAVARAMAQGQLDCPELELLDFPGAALVFSPAARVIAPFRERLLQFESVVASVAQRLYGRSPARVIVSGSYACRSVSGKNRRMSEHALGNAIDVAGFEFTRMAAWPDSPTALPGAFAVRVDRHWQARGDPAIERHARFLSQLTRELLDRGVFRTLLGPAHPEHADHFHFDMAPEPYVDL
jgi:hypothetical protein